jgi:hypothetical protein
VTDPIATLRHESIGLAAAALVATAHGIACLAEGRPVRAGIAFARAAPSAGLALVFAAVAWVNDRRGP